MCVNRVPQVFLILCVTAPWVVSTHPSAAGRSASLEAAAALCPTVCPASECSFHRLQTAEAVQNMTTATVLTCDSLHRQAFLEAIALFQPSGYLEDNKVVPYIVVQPSGTLCIIKDCDRAQLLLTLHCPSAANMQHCILQASCTQAFACVMQVQKRCSRL